MGDFTNEEAEGLRGGFPEDHGPGEQTGLPGYFKLVDLPDLFPVLSASAATLLRDVTVEEAVSLFHKFVGKNLTEDLVIRILEAYVPMKIQIRQEEVWGGLDWSPQWHLAGVARSGISSSNASWFHGFCASACRGCTSP